MKKIAIVIAFVFGFSFNIVAQSEMGGLFKYGEVAEDGYNFTVFYEPGLLRIGSFTAYPNLPGDHNLENNQSSPLGEGLLLLIGFGAAYALKKRK